MTPCHVGNEYLMAHLCNITNKTAGVSAVSAVSAANIDAHPCFLIHNNTKKIPLDC